MALFYRAWSLFSRIDERRLGTDIGLLGLAAVAGLAALAGLLALAWCLSLGLVVVALVVFAVLALVAHGVAALHG